MGKPKIPKPELTSRDYWHIGPVYVWKWIVVLLIAAAALLVLSVFGLPQGLFSSSGRAPPTYRFDDPKLAEVSGVVRVLDSRDELRYEGEVDQGAYTGRGKVFDVAGNLVYDGPLVDGVYEGPDALVYEDNTQVYSGEMAGNLYEGQGHRVDVEGGVVSEGQFSRGKLNGEGREYRSNGTLLREGTFKEDLLHGEGAEYGSDKTLLREGTFAQGLLHGVGIQYAASGTLQYEGEFQKGIYHGQGKLYNTLNGRTVYEGAFVWGEAVGLGRIYHPSGQLLYEGEVFEGKPRADAFLGLSLQDVETAFKEHWLLYTDGAVTAFVYPYFKLMFVTENPANLHSQTLESAEAERQRRELLEALKSQNIQVTENGEIVEMPAPSPTRTIETEPPTIALDMALAPDTVKTEIVICEVLSYGTLLPGTAQPAGDALPGQYVAGWREWFSDYAIGERPQGAVAGQTGPFVYEFVAVPNTVAQKVDVYLAAGDGIETRTVLREGKDTPLRYQSALRKETP